MRRLNPDERALWDKVVASVKPLHRTVSATPEAQPPVQAAPAVRAGPRQPVAPLKERKATTTRPGPGVTLDGGWDKRLSRGLVQPDSTVDLHGHNLATAYDLLDRQLDRAIVNGARVLLLVTGKPPTDDRRPVGRGAIRAAVGDWLAASRHAGQIAAVRGAHPRHGGSGALYIVLRRKRP
ncbi:MAG: mismatch repair protein MutS [Alphaproteobacteria bacterium]|nr:mismatch repair protein MutS [Alphaproteobacteria bacterium]